MFILIFLRNLSIFAVPAILAGSVAWKLASRSRDEWKLLAWVHVVPLAVWAPWIAWDATRDRTSHNLWPFELIFWMGLSLTLLGVFFVARFMFGRGDDLERLRHQRRG